MQAALLRRQIGELERRIEGLVASERKSREDLIAALGAGRDFASEQARLHEELANRERVLTETIASESALQEQVADLKSTIRRLESRPLLTGATEERSAAGAGELGTFRRSNAELVADILAAKGKLAELTNHIASRASLLGFLADQIRQNNRRQIQLRATLDCDAREASKSGRVAIESALASRLQVAKAEERLQDERWQAWRSETARSDGAPQRRNRAAKLLEKILCRLGSPGVALALSRSGLWNRNFRIDNQASAHRRSLLSYAHAGPAPDAPVNALFDQAYYLATNPSVGGSRRAPLAHYLVYGDRENRSPHPLVDVSFYRRTNPHELGSTGLTVLQHFLFVGARKGLNPHPLFDVRYYVSQLSDEQDRMTNPLVHYLRTGWRRGLNPHPLFDNDRYITRHPDVAEMMVAPLLHYVTIGASEGRDPHALFSSHWYQVAYPDVLKSGQNPLAHFLERGLYERRNPGPFFSSEHYLKEAPDAYSAGQNPLHHYLRSGAYQGASPNSDFDCIAFLLNDPSAIGSGLTPFEMWLEAGRPKVGPDTQARIESEATAHRASLELVFDREFYAEQVADLLAPGEDLLNHYMIAGWRLGLNPNRLFDTAWYLERYPEAMASGVSPLLHFVMNGREGLQDPHPLFDSRWYVERYPDVLAKNEIPLVHFIHFGAREGRSPGPLFDAGSYHSSYPDVAAAGQDGLTHFLTRWPLDNRPNSFPSPAAESPHGVSAHEWVAGIADALRRSVAR